MPDPHFYAVQRYQDELSALESHDLAIEDRAAEISGAELKAKAHEILSTLDEYASASGKLSVRALFEELMGE